MGPMNSTPSRLAGLSALWTLVSCAPTVGWALGRDQGIFAYTAWRMLHGDAVYSEAFTFKPPATLWTNVLAQGLFGPTQWGIRLVDLGLQATGAAAVAWLFATWTGDRRGALWAGLLYGPMVYGTGPWHTAQTDSWIGPCVLVGAVLAQRGTGWAHGMAGGALGLAVLYKYTALAFLLPLLILVGSPLGAVQLLLGVLVVLGGTGLWLVGADLLPAFLETQRLVLQHTRQETGLLPILGWLLVAMPGFLLARLGLFGLVVVPEAWRTADRDGRRGLLVMLAFGLAGLASLVSQGRYWPYHALPLVPALACGGGLLLSRLQERLGRPTWAVAPLALLVAFVGPQERDPRGTEPFEQLAAHLREQVGPDEPVFLLGFDPLPLFLAERRQVSRFSFDYPVRVQWHRPEDRAELLAALRADPPVRFVVATGDASPGMMGHDLDAAGSFDAWTELADWVERTYSGPEAVAGYRVYVRR